MYDLHGQNIPVIAPIDPKSVIRAVTLDSQLKEPLYESLGAVSSFMGYLKGKSSLMIYEQFADLKYKYRNREFWCPGYNVDTVGKNKAKIAEYIKHQLDEDRLGEQMTMLSKNNDDPFKGK